MGFLISSYSLVCRGAANHLAIPILDDAVTAQGCRPVTARAVLRILEHKTLDVAYRSSGQKTAWNGQTGQSVCMHQ